jgi:hypothetical protein
VGVVFQKSNPFPKSIYENVAYGIRINGMAKDRSDLNYRVEESLALGRVGESLRRVEECFLELSENSIDCSMRFNSGTCLSCAKGVFQRNARRQGDLKGCFRHESPILPPDLRRRLDEPPPESRHRIPPGRDSRS